MSDQRYIVLRGRTEYKLSQTRSDPYDEKYVKNCDEKLHKTLSEIFADQRHLTSAQMKKLLGAPEKHADKSSIVKMIMMREPALGKLLKKRNDLSLLWIAVLNCYQKSAELLVRSGANVNELCGLECELSKLTRKSTILHALMNMYPSSWNDQMIGTLIQHGINFQAQDCNGRTALHVAAQRGRVKAAESLLENGAEVNAVRCGGMTPLLDAARNSPVPDEMVPLLIRYGADITARCESGWNVLCHLACTDEEHVDLARLLIQKGVPPCSEDSDQHQPIHLAAFKGHEQFVNLLLDNGANVNARGHRGEYPLHCAAMRYTNPASVLLTLLQRGADVNAKTDSGATALHVLLKENTASLHITEKREKMDMLFFAGADLFAEDNDGRTPIFKIRDVLHYIPKFFQELARRQARLQPSTEFKVDRMIEEDYPLYVQEYYLDSAKEINEMKSMRFIETCTFFELLTKCQCQISPLMRHRKFKSKFQQFFRLCKFSNYAHLIYAAFERAERYHRSVLDLENEIAEAYCHTLTYEMVRKIAGYLMKCEICEVKMKVQASRSMSI